MTGEQYLAAIRTELVAAHRQHKMGENVLRAFGYIRRRRTVIEEINAALEKLGLVANPPIDSDMPLRRPRIVFSLRDTADAAIPIASNSADAVDLSSSNVLAQDEDDSDTDLPEPAFSVSELESADKKVEWVSPNASIYDAYSKMVLHKYSQLVVSSNCRTMQQAIKGIVSFQSMTKALMNGKPKIVGDCIDQDVRFVPSDADLKSVVSQLRGNDVVLVIGQDKRLRGIVTAWDLAEEFARLVDPFKRIGEIEELDFQEHWDAMNLPYGKSTLSSRNRRKLESPHVGEN